MLKIGKIQYANLYPIFYALEREADPSLFRFIQGVPSEINRLLREGSVDISPSSSIEYLRRPGQYTLINGHSISSYGAIESILLFSTVPIEELGGRTVLASSQSETSTALLRIILKKFYGLDTEILVSGMELNKGLQEYPAYLLIGDDALREAINLKTRMNDRTLASSRDHCVIFVYDLGKIWYEHTGLPFVFALWIAMRECCGTDEFSRFVEFLDRAKGYALTHLRDIAKESPYASMLGFEGLVRYWKIISYDFEENHRMGLELFRKYLIEENLL